MSPDAARIIKRLNRHKTFADLTDGGCGKALLKVATDGVQDTLAKEQSPNGIPWQPLTPGYLKRKTSKYGVLPMGVLERIMADPVEVEGIQTVTTSNAHVEYGWTDIAKDHAEWFSVVRPFWGFTTESVQASTDYLTTRFRRKI